MNLTNHILIIDDNQGIHRDFDLALQEDLHSADLDISEERVFGKSDLPRVKKPRFEIEHAQNGLEGIDKVKKAVAEKRPFQVAFVDIRMPGIDGVETVERIWKTDTSIQIVFCTAYSDYSWNDLTRRLGYTDKALVLKKPFDYIEVVQMACTLSEKWRLARQADMKMEEMELLVARRTRTLLELQKQRGYDVVKRDSSGNEKSTSDVAPMATNDAGELPLILLVGGDEKLRRAIFSEVGKKYRIFDAMELDEGIASARNIIPDVVITEFCGNVDGIEFCHRLKHDELAGQIPVILFGTDGPDTNEEKALKAGASGFFSVTGDIASLISQINVLIQKRLTTQGGESGCYDDSNQEDEVFLRRATEIVETQMADFEFDVEDLAKKMFMSRRQLLRKIKAVAGCSPNAFIRSLRLKRASRLLASSGMTVSEVTYAVGFSDLKYFRTVFKDQFGVLPTEFGRQNDQKMPEDHNGKQESQ